MATSLRFSRARTVAFYCATGEELDLWPLLLAAADAGKTCCLPVMTDRLARFESSPLWFQRFDPARASLVEGRFRMMEPAFNPRDRIRLTQLDVIFVPLVAFDRKGHRIGMGQGYYDRALAASGRHFRRPWLIGCGYSLQEVESIPANPWDIPLEAVVTEEGLIACG